MCRALPLLVYRGISYFSRHFQYFLIDYCYTVNVLGLLHLFVFPGNALLFRLFFMSACGPLAWAVVVWRNSMVLHDLERVTSVFIHLMPPILAYTRRTSRQCLCGCGGVPSRVPTPQPSHRTPTAMYRVAPDAQ